MYNQRPWAKCQHNSSFKGSELTLRLSNFPPAVPFSLCAFSACGSALLFSSIYIIGCLVCCVTTYISEFRSPSFLDWVSSKIQIPMDALQIHRTSSTCISSLRSASTPPTLGLLGQVRFAPLCNRRGRVFLHRTRSVRDRNEGEFRRFRNRSSAVEGEEETEIILGAERDGRIIGFHLVPESGNPFNPHDRNEDEFRDRSSAVEGEEKTEIILGAERDGSIIGFHLVPESDDEEVVDSDSTTSATKTIEEEIEGVKGEEPQVRVTHNIVFVTAEAAPYSKTGGLGDVCASLPVALSAHGHRVMVVSPRYLNGSPSDKKFSGAYDVQCRIKIPCFGALQEVAFFHEYRAGVDWVFVDHPSYQRPGNPYGDNYGAFGDNQFRFTLLCHAACEAPLVIPLGGFTYGEKCLFLVNDWHASLVPVLLAASYRPHGVYKDARSILIIHNLAHQGVEPAATYSNLGLPPEWYGAMGWIFPNWARTHALDTGEAVNFLKGAIVTADRILTVSEGYSWEITTPEGGYGLHDLLSSRKNVLNGITNGIDVIEWNPASDEHISSCYSVHDLAGKAQCKSALQKELGLPVRPECPMIGFIGRLDNQKGIDLIQSAIPELMQDDIQFVMLGSGDPQYEDWMKATESTYRDKFRGWVGFNVPISHRITAGCDILLMPSRFEPCGLNQLYAMRYGTVPVVHSTGGLRDTVKNFNPYAKEGNDQGTGWTFSPLSKENMLAALRVAIRTYREHKSSWEGLMKRGMERDCTWDNAAVQYEQVFEWAFSVPPYVQ